MNPFEEDVRGTIIGDVTNPYQFWAWREYGWTLRYYECIAHGSFRNDDEAEAWAWVMGKESLLDGHEPPDGGRWKEVTP